MRMGRDSHLYGYAGQLLRINLSRGTHHVEVPEKQTLRMFLGGVGYAASFLYSELAPGINPLSPDNKILFTTGPLTGTTAPGSGFAEVCFKSPLTGVWAESKCGGEWGGALRKAGYDFLVLEGKAKDRVYIAIDNDKIEIKPAEHLAGKTTSEKTSLIRGELTGEDYEVLVTGPAGEKLVRFANIMLGGRAFGRCGAGAVMGSKNLAGIAVRGTGLIPVAEPDAFLLASKAGNKKVLDATDGVGMAPGGTTGDIPACDEVGDIPTKNWRANSWGKGEKLYAHFEKKNLIKAAPCYKGCVLRCSRIVQVQGGKWTTPPHEGAEYESICAFTFFVLNEDMDAAVHATYLCNEFGLDTISTGAVIAFAMDCYEKGIIGKGEDDGLDLSWGNAETIVELVRRIGNREGLGRILGEGSRRASERIGRGSNALTIEVKGLEGPAHDARSGKTLAIMYALSNRGMCHIHPLEGMAYDSSKIDFGLIPYEIPDPNEINRFSEAGKGKLAKKLQDFGIVPDIVGICKFYLYNGLGPQDLAKLVCSLTGWDIDGEELLEIGDRVYTLQRMFNVREGIRKTDDMLPDRVRKLPEFGAYSKIPDCEIKNFASMLDECYEARGWSKEAGIPTDKKLKQLGLDRTIRP